MSTNKMTPEWRVAQVATTLAIENMHMSKQFKDELLSVARGEKSSNKLLEELNDKYKQHE